MSHANALALVALGASYADNGTGSMSYVSDVDLQLNLASLTSQPALLFGFLDPNITGDGFDALRFLLEVEGQDVLYGSFTDAAEAAWN